MSEITTKKLTLKERMALKRKKNKGKPGKTVTAFIPSSAKPKVLPKTPAQNKNPAPNQNKQPAQTNQTSGQQTGYQAPNQQPQYRQNGHQPNFQNNAQQQYGYGQQPYQGGYQGQMGYTPSPQHSFEQVHAMFKQRKINGNQYSMMLQGCMSQEEMQLNRQLAVGQITLAEKSKAMRDVQVESNKIMWTNMLKNSAENCQISAQMLQQAVKFLDFSQVNEIIQTYKESAMEMIKKINFNTEEEREQKNLEVEDYIRSIQNQLNDMLDKMEEQESGYESSYYQRNENYNGYKKPEKQVRRCKCPGKCRCGLRNKNKHKNEKKQQPKKKAPKERKRRIEVNAEESINIENLKIMNMERVKEIGKRGKLLQFDANKEPLNIIFIGHVDCGKSTICGNILVKSGKVKPMEIKRFEQEAKDKDRDSWYLAYIMDLNEEERAKGKTVEVGRATFETEKKRFTILDCPGHEKYLPNMLAGAAQADVAALVISAKPGEFESGFEKNGQTKEHAMLAKALGVQRLVIIVNKMDLVEWSKSRFDYIQENLTKYLMHNCGYESKNIFWTVISGLMGLNMDKRLPEGVAPWYFGKCLFETLDFLPEIEKTSKPFLRVPILDAFVDQGKVHLLGKVESGVVKSDMKCMLLPNQKELTVTKIFDNDDNQMLFAGPGENVKLQLHPKNCKPDEIDEFKRGYVLCGQQFWVNVATEFMAEVRVLELSKTQIFNQGFTAIMHLHTVLEEVSVKRIRARLTEEGEEEIDEITGRRKKVKKLRSQDRGVIVLKTNNPICLEKFSEFSELGRFTLRKDNNTIALGRITKFKPLDRELLQYHNFFFEKSAI